MHEPPLGRAVSLTRTRRRRWWTAATLALVLAGGAAVAAVTLADSGPRDTVPYSRAAQPVVDENHLVDSRTGRVFIPRGVNWSSFEYACAQGWGLSTLDTLRPDGADDEARAIASWGANTVRLPLNQDCWLGTRGAPVSDQLEERTVTDYRAEVSRLVEALNDAGLVAILDLHSRKRIGSDEFGSLAMPDAESLAFWDSVATAFRDHPSVMFDAFSAPYSRRDHAGRPVFDLTWPCWREGGCRPPAEDAQTATRGLVTYTAQGMDRVVGAIRGAGAGQPILLGGLDQANDLRHWLEFAPDDDQLVASFHSYDDRACATRACWDATVAPLAGSVPVVTTELGARRPLDGYVATYLDWADTRGVGSLFWVWGDRTAALSLRASAQEAPTAYGELARAYLSRLGRTGQPGPEGRSRGRD
ncbi:MAG: cellulase family glycosylhydrolase [Nocardioides sp.]|nr:cellulase family glycosylhydrolase [Nocardioides sp.]